MSLLNPLLAIGAIAFLVPLLIHIFNRSRFRTVEWGAMHLLESVISQNRKRLQIDQLILLLIRCLIPAVLAICLARPVLTGGGLLGNAPVASWCCWTTVIPWKRLIPPAHDSRPLWSRPVPSSTSCREALKWQ